MSRAASSRGGSLSAMRPARRGDVGGPAATAMTRCPAAARSSARRRASADMSAISAIAWSAPLAIRNSLPCRSTASASAILVAGSKGTKPTSRSTVSPLPVSAAARRIAASIGSWSASELARAASANTRARSKPGIGETASTSSALRVRVPVLSEHRTSMAAASCAAESLVNRTPCRAIVRAPIAAESVNVAGRATGMLARSAVSARRITSADGHAMRYA